MTQYYWPENFLINSLVPLLTSRGVQVTVLTGKPNYPGGKIFDGYRAAGLQIEDRGGVSVLRLPILSRGQGSKLRLAMNYLSFIGAGFLFGPRLLRNSEYDLVFVYAPSPLLQALPAIWLAGRRRVPLVVWVQDLWPESLSATGHVKNRILIGAVRHIVRLIYRASDRILVQSRAFIGPVAALANDPRKIRYYPNLYQPASAPRTSERASDLMKVLGEGFSIVFAGNLGTAQALDTVVEAARQLLQFPQIRIVLVGSGSLDQWLANQRSAYRLDNLVLAGRFDAADMPAIFDAADALLVSLRPDPAFDLTVPSKVQAYLAAGKPILAALNGEGARIVSEAAAGLCSPAGDATALAENMRRLAAMPLPERQNMGRSGQQYFHRNFAPDALADELIRHFADVVAETENDR